MDKDFAAEAEEVVIGRTVVRCPACGQSTRFFRSRRAHQPKADCRICAECGAERLYTELLEQVTRRTIADAERALSHGADVRAELVPALASAPLGPMKRNIYVQLISRAIATEGSSQAVAQMLRVPEGTLLRWAAGRAFMPDRAFRALIEYLARKDEQRAPARAISGAKVDPAERIEFFAAKVFASCARCSCPQFRRADATQPLTLISTLLCVGCGAAVVHKDLMRRFADEMIDFQRRRNRERAQMRARARK